jgi:hypothetical protein
VKKEQVRGEMDVGERGARVEVKWMLGREVNWGERRMGRIGKEWKSIGRIEKSVIPILLIQLVTICNRLIH